MGLAEEVAWFTGRIGEQKEVKGIPNTRTPHSLECKLHSALQLRG